MHLLLRRLPKLFHLETYNNVNVALIAIHCGSLKTLTINNRDLRPWEISALLRNNKLKSLQAQLNGRAPTQSIDTLPARLDQLQEPKLVYKAAIPEEGSTGLHVISSLLRKLPNIGTFGLTVEGTDDELPRVIRAASKHLEGLGIRVIYSRDAVYNLDHRVLQHFRELKVFEGHAETMLGVEYCKHKERGDSRHSKHMVSEMLPPSLEEF